MKKFSNLFFVLAVFAALSMSTHRISASWDDDPNSDKNPVFLSDGNSYLTSPMSVVTIDDFDNFDLGVDFAECHISENPLIPGQYFLAYNINGTYYTTNGIDWQRNNPTFPNSAGDPVSAWDSLGKLYYDNMKSPITGTWVVTSTNAGANWTSSV